MDPSKLEQPQHWIHFVGCFATRVTLYSQQVRALNRIHKLIENGQVPETKNSTIAIIGAGAAGITAATALALTGPDVSIDILETRGNILELQQQSSSRHLRPHIYDWPAATASQDDADLPILNWTANTAQEVAAVIADEFERLAGWDKERVDLLLFHEVKKIKACKSFYELTIKDHSKNETRIRYYRWILVCIGFGLEKMLGEKNRSYWDPSILKRSILRPPEPRVFVSGNGDGGLIDFAMAAFDALDHASIENLFINCQEIEEAKSTLRKIEDDAKRQHASKGEPIDLYEAYKEQIFLPKDLVEEIYKKLRKIVKILFHTREPQLFTLNSSILNRFIVFAIDRAMDQDGRIRMICGKELVGDPLDCARIEIDGEPPFCLDYRFLRFGPDRDEVRKPFLGLFKEPPVDYEVPTLLPAARSRFLEAKIASLEATKASTTTASSPSSSPKEPEASVAAAKQLGSPTDRTKRERPSAKQMGGRWWIYGLVGLKATERLSSVGCFRLDRKRKKKIQIGNGTVYRIDPNSGRIVEHWGNWESEPFDFYPDRMKFFYQMHRPPSMAVTERNWPSQYESAMELWKQLRVPLAGDECWEGRFEDLGHRRGVWGHILAEQLPDTVGSLEAAFDIVQKNGLTLINMLSKSMWPES